MGNLPCCNGSNPTSASAYVPLPNTNSTISAPPQAGTIGQTGAREGGDGEGGDDGLSQLMLLDAILSKSRSSMIPLESAGEQFAGTIGSNMPVPKNEQSKDGAVLEALLELKGLRGKVGREEVLKILQPPLASGPLKAELRSFLDSYRTATSNEKLLCDVYNGKVELQGAEGSRGEIVEFL